MDVNRDNLNILNTAVSTAFNQAFDAVDPQYTKVATVVPSSTAANTYAWLGKSTQIREWLGERVINRLKKHQYTIVNKSFEGTESIHTDEVEDDSYGVNVPLFQQLGQNAAQFPDKKIFSLLKFGFTEPCYDGQNFFDTDHPVGDDGSEESVSNMQAGSGEGWYLLCTKNPLKPLIWQKRKPFRLVMKKTPQESDHVFMTGEILWGVDGRGNAGFGLWQTAFGSKAELNDSNFNAAREEMMSFVNDAGEPLGVVPDLLVVGPKNMSAAENLLEAVNKANGATNTNYKKVELLVCPWLV